LETNIPKEGERTITITLVFVGVVDIEERICVSNIRFGFLG